MGFILSLDQGTTSSRAIVFDHAGRSRATAQAELEQIYPRPGWVEHDPNLIWSTQIAVAGQALDRAGIGPDDLVAVGLTNQRETTIVWDRRSGQPVHNALVWQDRRTAAMCDRLRSEGHDATIREKTGLLVDPYFSATKIAWILEHVSGARELAQAGKLAFGTVDTWLVWNLTGGARHLTDVSNASRTMLYDIHRNEWDDELLELFSIPRALLPEVRPSSELHDEIAAEPLRGVPLAGIAGDQQAALFGQTCFDPGSAKCTYGTGCFVLMNAGTVAPAPGERLIATLGWRSAGRTIYALEGSIFVGGAIVQWLRDGLGLIRSAPEVESLAATVADNGGVYFVPALTGLGAPHWDPHARGTILGLERGTRAGHLARAALEGIAFQVADVLDVMREEAGMALPELRVDGGAAANDLLLQFQADLLGTPVVRPTVTESTAVGAAYLAGLATGYWSDLGEIRGNVEIDRRFEPEMPRDRAATLRRRWAEALERSRGWEADPPPCGSP